MDPGARVLLEQLLLTPSPSGYEEPVQARVVERVRGFADEVRTDVHGNVIACRNPQGSPRVLLAGHCDQIGLVVSYIDDEGYLYTQTVGGWDPQQLIGQHMTVWTRDGAVPAVIARKPIHLLTDEERQKVVKTDELWLDIGARDREDAAAVVRIGDSVTLRLGMTELRHGLACAPGMDNTTGLWVVLEALRRAGAELKCALFAVSTVQEEIGLRGARTSAFGVDPQVGIAVDVTHATDCPTIQKNQQGDIRLGKGPVLVRGPNVNPVVFERLETVATSKGTPFQLAALGRGAPNDSNALQLTRAGVATGLVAIPNRYMHSAVETVSLDDLDHAADLLAAFATQLEPDADFTPGR